VKDLYALLGVEKNADLAAIKKAYRKLALKHHPDRNGGSKESEETFREITAAYSILSDEKLRRAYDLQKARPAPQAAPGGAYTAPAPQGNDGWAEVRKKYEAVKNSYFWRASERRRAQNEQRTRHSAASLSSWDDQPGTGIQAAFDMTKPFKVVRNEPALGESIKVIDPLGNTIPAFSVWKKKDKPNA
jgi:curved DNA-binding protein CbpA